jgi:serine/threonine-protein kinase
MSAALPVGNAPRTSLALGEVLVDATTGTRFRITGFIGKGGMGEVYLGEAEGSGAAVAIKTIPLALADDPKIALRTQFESQALRALRHRNVVPVLASGVRADGVIFMVMEYLSGMTLLELRRAQGRIPIAWSLEIVRDVALGLHAIHEHAVHRDVKPANLHFGVDAVVRVLDLGVAKWKRSGMRLTSTGTQVGTLAYMAPELLDESAPVDAAADIWSAGVVLYELLTDRHPFAFGGRLPENPFLLGNRILDELHVPLRDVAPLCPGFLARIVDRTLAKDPRERHPSAKALADELDAAMETFAREHGAAPPLDELAARTFVGAVRRPAPVTKKESGAAAGNLKHVHATVPLSAQAPRAQPESLPYQRTEDIASAVAEANARLAAMPARALVRASEPEPPRVSDVFLRRARVEETQPELHLPAPATVRDGSGPTRGPTAAPAAASPDGASLTRRAGASPGRRAALVIVGGLLLAVITGTLTTLVLGDGPETPPSAGAAVPSPARAAAPSASSTPRPGPTAAPSPARPGR